MATPAPSPYSFGTWSVVVTSSTGKSVDISRLTNAINFYESLTEPFITATVSFADSANVFNYINFIGQEKIDISISDFNGAQKIKKSFMVSSIEEQKKFNGGTSLYVIGLIEFHAYENNKVTFSRTFEGKPEEIIAEIAKQYLEKSVSVASPSAQGKRRFITPLTMQPMEVINTLRNKCTGPNGSPFFLHSGLYSDDLQLISLEALLAQPAFNSTPFLNSPLTKTNNGGGYSSEDFEELAHKVMDFKVHENQNVPKLLHDNTFGTHYNFLDVATQKAIESRYKVTEAVASLPTPNGVYDYSPTLPQEAGTPLHDASSGYSSHVTVSNMYEGIPGLHDEQTEQQHLLQAKKLGIARFMSKGYTNFRFPGWKFIERGQDVIGKAQVDVYIQKDRPLSEPMSKSEAKDKKRSGKYIPTHLRHIFLSNEYSVTMTGIKLDNDPALYGEIYYPNNEPDMGGSLGE